MVCVYSVSTDVWSWSGYALHLATERYWTVCGIILQFLTLLVSLKIVIEVGLRCADLHPPSRDRAKKESIVITPPYLFGAQRPPR